MYIKKLPSGSFRYTEKYKDKKGEIQKVQITLASKTKVMQAKARELLCEKIKLKMEKDSLIRTDSPLSLVYEKWKNTLRRTVRISSYNSYLSALKDFYDMFQDWQINNISTMNLQDYLLGKNWRTRTMKHKRVALSSLFTFAVKMKYISESPVHDVVLPRLKESLEEIEIEKNKCLSRDELRKVLDYCTINKRDKRLTLILEFIFLTGMRLSEIGGLQKSSVDLAAKKLTVRHVINTKGDREDAWKLYPPKTKGSIRDIHLNPRCIEIIQWFLDHLLEENFVFTSRTGYPLQQGVCYQFINSVCKKALGNPPNRKFNTHMLRHAHITMLAELKVPLKATMARVGHVNEAVTLRIYSHVSQEMVDETAHKLDALVI